MDHDPKSVPPSAGEPAGPDLTDLLREIAGGTPRSGLQLSQYPITDAMADQLQEAFTYHPPKGNQTLRYTAIRHQALVLACAIVRMSPPGREQDRALERLEEAVMLANAAIARGER